MQMFVFSVLISIIISPVLKHLLINTQFDNALFPVYSDLSLGILIYVQVLKTSCRRKMRR